MRTRACLTAPWVISLALTAAACGDTRSAGSGETSADGADAGEASSTGGATALATGGAGGDFSPGGAGGAGFDMATGGTTLDLDPPPPPACPGPGDPQEAAPLGPLDVYVVGRGDVGRRVIYSWTTREQVEELRLDPALLTRVASATGERGRATDTLAARVAQDRVAALLSGPDFERKRFGWTNAWATLLGWTGESYGDQLLEIQLRPEALIARFDTTTTEWSFFDVDNQPVELQTALEAPERIAAIYFIDGKSSGHCGGSLGPGPAYREYILCNERMIERWSTRTAPLRDHLATAHDALATLRDALAAEGCRVADADVQCWRDAVLALWDAAPINPLQAYEASLAFPNDLYMPSANNLERLMARIQATLFIPDPLTHDYPPLP